MKKKEIIFFNSLKNSKGFEHFLSLVSSHFPFLKEENDISEISNDKVLFYLLDEGIFDEDLWLDDSHAVPLILITSIKRQGEIHSFLRKNNKCDFLVLYREEDNYLTERKLIHFICVLLRRETEAYYKELSDSLCELAIRNISLHHNVNNIITPIDSSIRMIGEVVKVNSSQLKEEINVKLRKYLEMEKKAVNRVVKYMDDVRLDFHETITKFTKDKIDIIEIVKEIAQTFIYFKNFKIQINVLHSEKKILTKVNDRLFYFLIFRLFELIISGNDLKKIEINFYKNPLDFKISIESCKKNSILPLDKYLIICFEKLRASYGEIQKQEKNEFSIIFPIF